MPPWRYGAPMIEREIATCLLDLFERYPFVTVTGPRQSGKTTLCRAAFPDLEYVNLEAPDRREFAQSDPRGFLFRLGEGAVLDRLLHHSQVLNIKGRSYRLRDHEQAISLRQ